MLVPDERIELATRQDSDREELRHVWLDVEGQRLIAADGFIAAVVPTELDESDQAGPVPVEAIAFARELKPLAASRYIFSGAEGLCPSMLDTPVGVPWFPRPDVKLNSVQTVETLKPTPLLPAPLLNIDAAELYNLARAVCADQKHLHISIHAGPRRQAALLVRPLTHSRAWGLIAPIVRFKIDLYRGEIDPIYELIPTLRHLLAGAADKVEIGGDDLARLRRAVGLTEGAE